MNACASSLGAFGDEVVLGFARDTITLMPASDQAAVSGGAVLAPTIIPGGVALRPAAPLMDVIEGIGRGGIRLARCAPLTSVVPSTPGSAACTDGVGNAPTSITATHTIRVVSR